MRTLKLIILSLMVCCVQSAWATEVTIDGIKYSLDESNKTATLIFDGRVSYIKVRGGIIKTYDSAYTGDIVVPSSVEYAGPTYTVTAIRDTAFINSSITSISIPESVTSLGERCFWNCSRLTSITIPESVTSWGARCFERCSSLTSITIQKGVTSLGDYCFYRCSSLTSINIPESVTSLGRYCFSGCSSLTSITIPESVTSLGGACFSGCSSLTSISIPESVTSLENSCFYGCSSLTSIQVAEGNTMYDSRENCNAVIETATNTMVAGCGSTIIPQSVTSLGGGCFYGCSSLTAIDLPKSITSLGNGCFRECNNLTVMRVYAETPPDLGGNQFPKESEEFLKVYVSGKALEQYQNSSWASLTKIIYPFIEQIELASDFSMARGAEKKMDYKLLPEGADDDAVDWSSGDSSIVSVSANGILKAFQLGKVSINATATDGGNAVVTKFVTNSTTIVVRDPILVQSINIPSEVCVTRGSTYTFTPTVSPSTADQQTLAWASDNESVATVDGNGVVTGVGPGTATITATTTDGSNLSASCVITVLTGGSVIKICPYGCGENENMALSSSTTGGTYYDYVLTSTELAGQEGGNEWTLVDAGDGTFYLRNGVGLYWAFQQSYTQNYYMKTVSDQSEAVKMSLVWNTTYSGVAFKNAHDGTYLCNLYGWNYAYNWYDGDEPLTSDTNYTYNVYVSSYKAAGIDGISADEETDAVYYQLNGVKLAGEPQKEGIYIRVKDGQSHKVVVKRK